MSIHAERPTKLLFSLVMAASLALPTGALAQTSDITATAEQLFEEGRSLMDKGRFGEACPKLAESHRLDPAVGTLLNLAECYEKQGRTASAWATYLEAETLATRLNQAPRATFAAQRARQLVVTLPRLAIRVTETRSEGNAVTVTVRRDGEALARPAWSTLVPVDPGEHRIEASAPGFLPFTRSVRAVAGQPVEVVVPALVPDASAAARPSSAQKTIGLVIAGAGLAAAGVGLTFGAIAKSKNDDARSNYCTPVACKQQGVDLLREADSAALLSTVLVSIGAAVLVGGIVTFVTAPSANKAPSHASLLGGTF
jgi:hypothetical protein